MSITLTRPKARLRRPLAGIMTTAVAASALALLPSTAAQAAPTGDTVGGTATWGLSTYLNSSTMGRPNPLAAGYVAPATFDETTKLSSWGDATGTIAADGSAALSFKGTSVNFSKTAGAWLKLQDPQAQVDASGNGVVSAVVSYGTAPGTYPNIAFDPAQAPTRGPKRVNVMTLAGNSSTDRALTAATATWSGLDGTWSADFTSFLAGNATAEDPAVGGFIYAGQINNASADRPPLPISFSINRATAAITSASITEQTPTSLKVAVSGDGFKSGGVGVYVSIGKTGSTSVTDAAQYLGTVWSANPANPASAVKSDGSFTTVLNLSSADIAKLDPTQSYSVIVMKAHGQATADPSQTVSVPVAIDFKALGLVTAKATSTPSVNVPASSYGSARTVTVTIPQVGSSTPTGTISLSGAVNQSAGLSGGAATFQLPSTLSAGSKTLIASYSGDASYAASTFSQTITIAKAAVKVTRNKITKKPTSKKAGKTSLTLRSATGGPAVTGKVTVTFAKKGQKSKTKTVTVRNGKGNVTIPKLTKGTWRISVKYTGTANFAKTATTKIGTVKVTK